MIAGVVIVLVNVDPQKDASGLLAAIRRLSDKPVRFIVNTTIDADHNAGNEAVAKSGQVLAGGNTRPATVTGTGVADASVGLFRYH